MHLTPEDQAALPDVGDTVEILAEDSSTLHVVHSLQTHLEYGLAFTYWCREPQGSVVHAASIHSIPKFLAQVRAGTARIVKNAAGVAQR